MKSNDFSIDFFLVGAARSGTTSLFNYLKNCEDIFLPDVKEPNYFSEVDSPNSEDFRIPEKGVKYHAKIINDFEVYRSLYESASNDQLKGDTSPSYLWDKTVAKKLYEHNPKAKIIISLRHPVDRAYSHYVMNYYTGVEKKKTFKQALENVKSTVWGACNCYLEMGMYYAQVKAYFDVFPPQQIMVLVYEDWTQNLEDRLSQIFEFLEIDHEKNEINTVVEQNKIQPLKGLRILNFLRQNKIKSLFKRLLGQKNIDGLKTKIFSRSKPIPKLDPKLRSELFLNFKEDIDKLSSLTDIDFNNTWRP